jgi:hypothetical protein
MIKVCKECGSEFSNHSAYANHIRWKHTQINSKNLSAAVVKGNNTRYGEWVIKNVECSNQNCLNTFEIKYRSKKGPLLKNFCSRSCANSRGKRSEDFKKTVSSKIKQKWQSGSYDHIDCSTNKIFSSKTERSILMHFKKTYPNDEWTSGGNIKHNGVSLVRDMYSAKLKICFEYDGVWHFKDIHGQLKDKQTKDAALEDWCKQNDYRLIRIEESSFESFSQIEKAIYKDTEKIIKIGTSYNNC